MLRPIILTRPVSPNIFEDSFLYLITKSDVSEGRITELRLYEQSSKNQFEKEAGVFIGEHTFKIELDFFKSGVFESTPIKVADFEIQVKLKGATVYTVLNSEFYELLIDEKSSLKFKNDLIPEIEEDSKINITGRLGYNINDIPALIKHAIIMNICYWFDNPENVNKRFNTAFDSVIDNFRQSWV